MKIRKKRNRTHRSPNKKFWLAGKTVFIWYIAVLAAIMFISPTLAGFNDLEKTDVTIEAATWPIPWMQSKIELDADEGWIESCEPVSISAVFINNGLYETLEGSYSILYDGTEMAGGTIEQLPSGEAAILSSVAYGPGTYTFYAYQVGDYASEYYDSVTISCPPPPEEEKPVETDSEKGKRKPGDEESEERLKEDQGGKKEGEAAPPGDIKDPAQGKNPPVQDDKKPSSPINEEYDKQEKEPPATGENNKKGSGEESNEKEAVKDSVIDQKALQKAETGSSAGRGS